MGIREQSARHAMSPLKKSAGLRTVPSVRVCVASPTSMRGHLDVSRRAENDRPEEHRRVRVNQPKYLESLRTSR